MSKRLRHVVDHGEVAHLWYHQTQDWAKSKGRGQLYFRGDTIYSYGGHFPIARHVKNDKGEAAVLFTTRDYSHTTGMHKRGTRSAIPSTARVFYIERPDRMPTVVDVQDKERKAAELLAKSKRARANKASYLSRANSLLEDARNMVEFFGLKHTVATPEGLKGVAEQIEQARKEQRERERQAEKRRIEEAQEKIALWKAGTYGGYVPSSIKTAFGRIEGNELVTSRGARVPLEHVKKVAPLVRSIIEKGKTFKRNGHTIHLGHYQLDAIHADGTLIAGCHTFERAEVLRILDMVEKA
jgi:hypothetical protein